MPDHDPPETPPQDGDPLLTAYVERRGNLLRFFAARTGARVAEDLVQELYVKLATRPSGEVADSPVALLYRIATNLMLDDARGRRRASARDNAWREAVQVSLGGQDIADEPTAEAAAASRQRLRQLAAAVGDLPPQMQRAFQLHKLEGLSHAETAAAMGLSVKSVEKHISAALRNLTAKFDR